MQTKTLEELKAENAQAEQAEAESVNGLSENTEDEAETQEASSTEQEESTEEVLTPELEPWMQSDQEDDAGKKFTDSDIGKAKAKLRAKLEREHSSEVDQLKQQIEELKRVKPVGGEELVKPKRTDFDNHDDPDDAYTDAVVEWKIKVNQAEQSAATTHADLQRKQLEQKARLTEAVDQHYERAVKLSEETGITPELYQGADLMVRREVDRLFPDKGDAITDALIANLGEGSEKVFYSLGVNSTKRAKLAGLLEADPSGIQAAVFLGTLKAELNAPAKRKSNAPAPSPNLDGDKGVNQGGDFLKKYKKAHQSGDMQSALNAKLAAKRAGVNVKDW